MVLINRTVRQLWSEIKKKEVSVLWGWKSPCGDFAEINEAATAAPGEGKIWPADNDALSCGDVRGQGKIDVKKVIVEEEKVELNNRGVR